MNEDNLKLWDSLASTPDDAVKAPAPGTNGLSSINGQYCFKRATEAFGIAGIGWGWEIMDRYITEGPEIKSSGQNESQMTLKVKVWFIVDGKRGELEQYGHTPLIRGTKYGASMDSDPEKKSLTDAIKKALTFIGIGADIHLGHFDDRDYMESKRLEENIKEDIEREKKETALKQGVKDYMDKCLPMYEHIKTEPAINQQYKKDVAHINREFARLKMDSANHVAKIAETANNQKKLLKGDK